MSLTSHGPAALGWPATGGAVVGNRVVVASRNLPNAPYAEVDLTGLTLVRTGEFGAGDGAWAMTSRRGTQVVAGLLGAPQRDNVLIIDGPEHEVLARVDANYVWDVDDFDGGSVLAVTMQPSRVLLLRTGREPLPLGTLPAGATPRTCAVLSSSEFVVGGSRDGRAGLWVGRRSQQQGRDILPAALADDEIVYATARTPDGLVALGTIGHRRSAPAIAVVDPRSPAPTIAVRVPGESAIDTVAVDGDVVFATARPSGALYALTRSTRKLQRLAVPVPQSETRMLEVRAGLVVGVAGDATIWKVDLATGRVGSRTAHHIGIPAGPVRAQSICAGEGHVTVGGTFNVTRHRTASGERLVRAVPGEPKAIVDVGGWSYLAMYPVGEIWSWAPRGSRPVRMAVLEPGQIRPHAMVHVHDPADDLDLLAVTTTDDHARSILHLVPRDGGAVRQVHDVLPGQVLAGVGSREGTVFVGGSGSSPSVAAVDAATGTVLWRVHDVIPDGSFILGILPVDGHLLVSSVRGWVTTIDLATQQAKAPRQVWSSAGHLRPHPDGPLLATIDALLRIDPATSSATVLEDDLNAQYWGWAPLDVDEDGRAWLIRDRDLVSRSPTPLT